MSGCLKPLAALAIALAFTATAAETSGRVLEIQGSWQIIPTRPLQAGMALQPGDRLTPRSPNHRIEYVLFDGSTHRCGTGLAPCPQPFLSIPSTRPEAGTLWARLFGSRTPAPSLVFAMSRGGAPSEALLLVDDGKLHLAPALQMVEPGEYSIRLRNLRSPAAPIEFEFTWNPKSPEPAPVAVLPGLYELILTEGGATVGSPGGVLIVDDPRFRKLQPDWQAAITAVTALEAGSIAKRRLLWTALAGFE